MQIRLNQTESTVHAALHWAIVLLLALLVMAAVLAQAAMTSADPLSAPVANAKREPAGPSPALYLKSEQSVLSSRRTSSRARTIVYGYDSAGRLSSASYDNGVVQRYGYDSAGNLTEHSPTNLLYLPVLGR